MATRLASLFALIALAATAALAAISPAPASAQETTIDVGDTWFCDASQQGSVCDTTIPVGGTVTWDFSGASLQHTTTECGASCASPTGSPLWDSGPMSGGTFSHTFDTAGTFLYHCEVHPTLMNGRIIVVGADTPGPPTATATATSQGQVGAATATPTSGGLPTTGTGGATGDGSAGWLIAVAAAVAGGFGIAGGALYLRRRGADGV